MRTYEELIELDRQQIANDDRAEALVVASELYKLSRLDDGDTVLRAESKEADKKLIKMCSVFNLTYEDLWGIQGHYVG